MFETGVSRIGNGSTSQIIMQEVTFALFFSLKKKTKASENKSKIKVMTKAPANKRLLRLLPTRFFLDQQSAWLNFCSFLRNLKKEFIRKSKLHEVLQQCYNSSEFGPIWFCTYHFETQQTST
jgi:hypothetical protein